MRLSTRSAEEPSDREEEFSDEEEAEAGSKRKEKKKKSVTIAKYYSYRLMVRAGVTNVLHLGQRLFQQYVVDMFCKKETNEMNFLRFNQNKLRASTYRVVQQLADYRGRPGDVGRHIILPSSYHRQSTACASALLRCHGDCPRAR